MAPISRRKFLERSLMAGAGLVAGGGAAGLLGGCTSFRGGRPRPVPPSGRVLADLHAHPTMNAWLARSPLAVRNPLRVRLATQRLNKTRADWKACHRAGVNAICVAHYNVFDEIGSMPTDPNPEAPTSVDLMLNLFEEDLDGPLAPYVRLARNYQDLEAQLKVRPPSADFRVSAIHCLEGGHALGGSLDPIPEFARRGVAWMTITHFLYKGIASAGNALPFFPDDSNPIPDRGLSDFGVDVVRQLEAHGILVDITHCTMTAVADVLDVAERPLMATHASSATLAHRPYGLIDDHIVEIVRRGGIVGVILYPYITNNYSHIGVARKRATLADAVRTVRYIAKITGTHKHIGIGSDFSGYIEGPKDMSRLSEIGKLRDLLLQEFDNDVRVVEDILVNNATGFLLKNWRSGLAA